MGSEQDPKNNSDSEERARKEREDKEKNAKESEALLNTLSPTINTGLQQPNTSPITIRPTMTSSNPVPPASSKQENNPFMEEIISRIVNKLNEGKEPKEYSSGTMDAKGNSIIIGNHGPLLSISPEKVTMLQKFSSEFDPPSKENEEKAAALITAGKEMHGKKAILYYEIKETNDPKEFARRLQESEFLKKQAEKHGVPFASSAKELAEIRAILNQQFPSDAPTSSSLQNTSSLQEPRQFGSVNTDVNTEGLVISQTVNPSTMPEPSAPLIPEPAEPPLDPYKEAIHRLENNDKQYIKELLEKGGNKFFNVEGLDGGGLKISLKQIEGQSPDDAKKLIDEMAKATSTMFQEVGSLSESAKVIENNRIVIDRSRSDNLKESVGITTPKVSPSSSSHH